MRRRRRQSTQTIRKKKFKSPGQPFQSSGVSSAINRRRWPLPLFIVLILLVSGSLYFSSEIVQFFTAAKPAENLISGSKSQSEDQAAQNTQPDPVEQTVVKPRTFTPIEKKIQVEVLNGCGEKGVASIFESFLKANGFDVVNTDNYRVRGKINWNVKKTFVADQTGNRDYAEQIAESLGLADEQVSSENIPSPICDVRLVIGKDFKSIDAFRNFKN